MSPLSGIIRFQGEHSFLSNFYPSPMHIDGVDYATVEHAYQAAKTLDDELRRHIAAQPTPAKAKWAGRKLELRPNWHTIRDGIMLGLLKVKFRDAGLRQKLDETLPHSLTEGNNWHDTYWGRCFCSRCKGAGHNRLGQLLMIVRGV